MEQTIGTPGRSRRRIRLYGEADPRRRSARLQTIDRISSRIDVRESDPAFYGRGAMHVMGLGNRKTGLHQPVTGRRTAQETAAVSRRGVRLQYARMYLAGLFLVLAVLTLINLSGMLSLRNTVEGIQRDIDSVTETRDDLQSALTAKESGINVGYEAARMGMVSSKSVDVIYLTLDDSATIKTADNSVDTAALAATVIR